MGTAAPHPPRRVRGEAPLQEGRDTQEGASLPQHALLYAACPQSAPRPLPQYPQHAGSPAPACKSTPLAAPGWRHTDVSRSSVGGRAMTRRPSLLPAEVGAERRTEAEQPPHPPPHGAPRPSP